MAAVDPEVVFNLWMGAFIGFVLLIFVAAYSIRDRWQR